MKLSNSVTKKILSDFLKPKIMSESVVKKERWFLFITNHSDILGEDEEI